MCPDPQILSIYIDGELPSPWKEKMETHLNACSKCKEKFKDLKYVHDLFKGGARPAPIEQRRTIVERNEAETFRQTLTETEILEDSKEKVWKKIASIQMGAYRHPRKFHKEKFAGTFGSGNSKGLVWKSGYIRGYSIWQQKLSIPLPVAAAAAILVLFGIAFLIQNRNSANNNTSGFASTQLEFPNLTDEMPVNFSPAVSDLNSVLQYLDSSGADVIILQLPENSNFSRSGEPQIIRAADYSRIDNTQRRRRP